MAASLILMFSLLTSMLPHFFYRIELPSSVKATSTEKDQQDFETSNIYNEKTQAQVENLSKSSQKASTVLHYNSICIC